MTLASFLLQLLNGFSSASALFLVAAGLTLIFGVTRIVNFAHGSLYMLGAYCAYGFTNLLAEALGRGGASFWLAVVLAALVVAALGALIEILLLKRLYAAPELLQLTATFAVVLIVRDAALAAQCQRRWPEHHDLVTTSSDYQFRAHYQEAARSSAKS